MPKYNDYRQYEQRKWVPVEYGTPSKELEKVLVMTSEGFVEECRYSRHDKVWYRVEDDSVVGNVKSWAVTQDSFPRRPTE